MSEFRKKPVVIEASQFWKDAYDGMDHDEFEAVCYCDDGRGAHPRADAQHIHTLEGPLHVTDGDWIIRGIQGEFYPCKPDIFEQTYEPATVPVLETPPPPCDDPLHSPLGKHWHTNDSLKESLSAPVEPVPAPTLDRVKTLLREFKAEGTYEFKAETAPEAFLQQEIKSLLADLDEALSAPVPAPRLDESC